MTNKNQKMLREIANDTQTPKTRDSKVQNDLWENINDDELTRLDRLKTGRRNFS